MWLPFLNFSKLHCFVKISTLLGGGTNCPPPKSENVKKKQRILGHDYKNPWHGLTQTVMHHAKWVIYSCTPKSAVFFLIPPLLGGGGKNCPPPPKVKILKKNSGFWGTTIKTHGIWLTQTVMHHAKRVIYSCTPKSAVFF
jgi:hypothetical protein